MGNPATQLRERPPSRFDPARDPNAIHIPASFATLPMTIRLASPITDDELYDFCYENSDLRIEQTASGEVVVMAPTGGQTGRRNSLLNARFVSWAERDRGGVVFDSSTGFVLPNTAKRAPDLAWVARARWDALTDDQKEKFVPLCPDFAAELRSPTDALASVQDKCAEYIANGARLVWLIDPVEGRVHVYQGDAVTVLERPESLTGEAVLPGLRLDLTDVLL